MVKVQNLKGMNLNEVSLAPQAEAFQVPRGSLEGSLISKVDPVLSELGYALRDIEVVGSRSNPTVRIYLESRYSDKEGDQEIGIEDCSKVHEILGPLFDVWDPIPTAYTLEVSSSGEKPSLRLLRHFEKALGQKVDFETLEAMPMPAPAKPRKNFKNVVLKALRVQELSIEIEDTLGTFVIPVSKLKSAFWQREWVRSK